MGEELYYIIDISKNYFKLYHVHDENLRKGFKINLISAPDKYIFQYKPIGFGFLDWFKNEIPFLSKNAIYILVKYFLDNKIITDETIESIKLLGLVAQKLATSQKINIFTQKDISFWIAYGIYTEPEKVIEELGLTP